jgi:hypothetical protein
VELGDLEGPPRCLQLVHTLRVDAERDARFLFAPHGSGRVWLDGAEVLQLAGPARARLDQAASFPAHLTPGAHQLVVRTCPEAGRTGFYLMQRTGR